MTSFQIGMRVRLIGTPFTGRVMGLVRYGLQVVMDNTGDWLVYLPDRWEVVE